jgi:hypothetical protein
MIQKTNEIPNENPIIYVLLVLGILSFIAVFSVSGLQNVSFFVFNVTEVVGFLCGLCALPIGFKLTGIRLNEKRISDIVST